MQEEMIQQAQQYHTQTLAQAMLAIEQMSAVRQREVFDFIDFMRFRNDISLAELDKNKENQPATENKPLMGSTIIELFADVSMTDEEVAVFDEIRKDDDSEPVSFD